MEIRADELRADDIRPYGVGVEGCFGLILARNPSPIVGADIIRPPGSLRPIPDWPPTKPVLYRVEPKPP